MFDFDEIIRQAQNGEAANNIAKTFNLTQEQTQAALDQMLPAFAEGFKRNAENMNQMAQTMQMFATNQNTNFFNDATEAFSANAFTQGNNILGQIFGSKDMSRAIADQTANFAGIGSDIAKQMLPVIASILSGGMQQQMASQNPFEAFMKQMSGGASMAAENPLTSMMEGFMKSMTPGGSDPAQPASESNEAAGEFGDLFKEMFQAGRKVQSAQSDALETIFDHFRKKPDA